VRWQHVGGVARQAQRVSQVLAPEDRTGQRTTLTDRLAEIVERYGAEHLVVRCLQRAHDHLASTVERTEERMWAAGVRD
jgi:hypothetical protein